MTANHPTTSREVRIGALAALQALQAAEYMAEEYEGSSDDGNTPQEAIQADIGHRQRVVAAFLEAAGDLPHHGRGFVAALAEYIDFGLRIGEPDLNAWKPDAAMTANEIEQSRADTMVDMLVNA